MSFVHLHVHSGYSQDSVIKIDELVHTAQSMNMPAVALTDHGQMFGTMEFYKTARGAGVKPILGVETYVVPYRRHRGTNEPGHHLVLLAEHLEGYQNLCRLISLANIEGFACGQPRVDKELLAAHSKGLIALSACFQGEIPSLLQEGLPEKARIAAEGYARLFPSRFYLELHRHGLPDQDAVNAGLVEIGRTLGLPLVAANDCHYLEKEQAELHKILLCGRMGRTLAEVEGFIFPSPEYYFKSPSDMAAAFPDLPEALANTLAVAERCQVEFPPARRVFPAFPAEKSSQLAGIVTFTRFSLPLALALVGRTLGLDEDEVEFLSSLARQERGEAELGQAVRDNPGLAKLLAWAAELENLPSHASNHPTDLVFSDQPLWEYLPLARLPAWDEEEAEAQEAAIDQATDETTAETCEKIELITQYEQEYVKALGLVKLYLPSLKNLIHYRRP